MIRSIGVRASSASSLPSPRTAFRRVRVIATDIIDDETYGRLFGYSWIVVTAVTEFAGSRPVSRSSSDRRTNEAGDGRQT